MRYPIVIWCFSVCSVLSVASAQSTAEVSVTRRWTPAELFAEATSMHLRLSTDGSAIETADEELIENDGAAAGFSYQPNEEKLGPDIRIKKSLFQMGELATEATLLVGTNGKIEATINGKEASLELLGKEGNYWQKYRFDPKLLTSGQNDIVIRGTGTVNIARVEDFAKVGRPRPHRNSSAKSSDGGQTWDYDRLGINDDIRGEYYVRLFLKRSQLPSKLTTPVIDLGNLDRKKISPAAGSVRSAELTIDFEPMPAGQHWIVSYFLVRSGPTAVPDWQWSGWDPYYHENASSHRSSSIIPYKGRYMQAQLLFAPGVPIDKARLKSFSVSARPEPADDWTAALKLVGEHNPTIHRTSIPFEYEPFRHRELMQFCEEQSLNRVVAGAKTEWELIEKLAAWSSQRWEKGHLNTIYPAWNAREILKLHEDGTPIGGFCQQYNLVFLQACESFGLVGRVVSLGSGNRTDKIRSGHETVEIWSNDYEKWVYVDGNTAWYLIDSATKIPLSHLELRERQLASFAGRDFKPVEVRVLAKTKYEWTGLQSFPPFMELRMIPRSNFLEAPYPIPLNQGMRGWFWTGHYVWTDDIQPAAMLYGNREHRKENWNWSVNQVHITLEPTTTKGEFRVHCDTETPGFETFVAKIDGGEAEPVKSGFAWTLKPGKNRVELRSRNITGRDGAASWIELEKPE